jgi:hypothetical protein
MASNPTEFIRVVELVQQFFDNPERRTAVNSPSGCHYETKTAPACDRPASVYHDNQGPEILRC